MKTFFNNMCLLVLNKDSMKKFFLFILISGWLINPGIAQDSMVSRIPLIGEAAPEFTAESTMGTINFPKDYYAKWKILFSHPADFTAVCSSEILELANLQKDFKDLNAQLVVVSTDAVSSHIEWVKSLETAKYKSREPVKINFPLVSDKNLEVSQAYGMIHSYSSTTKDVRGVFIIDPNDKIRAIFFYPMEIGRNLDEIKRTLIALQTAEKQNVLIPADWQPGQDVMLHSPKTSAEADKLAEKATPGLYSINWYMWFKKAD
jgi:peroxiredoxin (alkyl hydroperoxide reductase subunit C)